VLVANFCPKKKEEKEKDGHKFARNCVKNVRQQLPFLFVFSLL
jgi:hypothetical protein